LELWKHHASTGGDKSKDDKSKDDKSKDDKSKMATVASWLLGLDAAILAYLVTHVLFTESVSQDERRQSVVVGALGVAWPFPWPAPTSLCSTVVMPTATGGLRTP
jgi:hypothetical protein